MRAQGEMNIGILLHPYGNHPAAWLWPEAPQNVHTDLGHFTRLARLAEQGLLDFIFFADTPSIRDGRMEALSRWPTYMAQFEPITLLSALAAVTDRIGLAATASTSYFEPYNVARQFASLDHLSRGRAAWNVVTGQNATAALNFGGGQQEDHATRYARAAEFVEIVLGLWDSWEADAFIQDRAKGVFFDPDKLHRLNYKGAFFNVRGPLNVPRTPQGRPVIMQAGGSEPGKRLAAETAEVVFTADPSLERSRAFYHDLKGRMGAFGRAPDHLKVVAGLNPIIGRTEAEAQAKFRQLQSSTHEAVAREILSIDLDGVNLSDLPLDSPIPEDRLPQDTKGGKTYLALIRRLIAEGRGTIRQLSDYYTAARGGNFLVGTPAQVADLMEHWYREEATDGFMIGMSYLPDGLREFVELVIPELQRRGLFRTGYGGPTLRDHLGLPVPANRYSGPA